MIAGKAEPRDAPASDVTKANRATGGNDARERGTASVSCAKNAADTGSGDAGDGNTVLFKDLENAEVRESAREASAKGQADAWPKGRVCRVAQADLIVVHHGTSLAAAL